jgi:hypothetical protein
MTALTIQDVSRRSGLSERLGGRPGRPDDGWKAALAGCEAVYHVASPLPYVQPADPDEQIVPAREGVLRVLRVARAAWDLMERGGGDTARFGVAGVRDVADLHIRAMAAPAAAGKRFLGVADGPTISYATSACSRIPNNRRRGLHLSKDAVALSALAQQLTRYRSG